MKFTISKNILLENLNYVAKAISTKNIIPILNGIKFELNKEGLYLTATDSELTIQTFIENKKIKNIEAEGIIIIQSKYLIDIVRKMPTDDINIEVVDGLKIKIYTTQNQYSLNCLEPKEYPKFKIESSKVPLVLNSDMLKELINQTAFAISTQESRPLLTGINLKITGDILELTATDSYRLAKKSIKLPLSIKEDINIVIPGKNLIEFDKILNDNDQVEIHIFNSKILFKYKNIIFQSNLLNGTYPNTANLIPTDFELIVDVSLSDYYDAIDRAALLTQSKDKNIVKMSVEEKNMKISSYASEIGKVEETVNIKKNNKNILDISFSAKYMLEALRTIKEDKILILLNTDIKPIIIKSVKDESLIQLILPIKTY
ncbi:MAG TPA: DNA polymerase III subunit beta [Bacilli bacterium]|nr:DNA polymerase III subunit beta [Bacilli bacterium]